MRRTTRWGCRSRAPCSPWPGPPPMPPSRTPRRRAPGPARSSRVAAQAAREALARTPEQLAVLAEAGVVDAGGRGICVILDAAETVLTGRRPVPVTAPLGTHTIPTPVPHDLVRGRAGVRGDVPPGRRRRPHPAPQDDPRRRSATPWSSSAASGCGTSTSTSTTSAPPSRPGWTRAARTGSGSPTSPSRSRRSATAAARCATAGGSSPSPPVPGCTRSSRAPGAVVVDGGPGDRPSTGMLLEAITGVRRRRGRGAAQRPRLRPGRRDRRTHRRVRPRPPGRGHPHRRRRCRVSPRSRCTSPAGLRLRRPGDDGHRAARAARRGHGRGPRRR